jgi:hypothetical protein
VAPNQDGKGRVIALPIKEVQQLSIRQAIRGP